MESISVVFPAYNDAVTIGGLVDKTADLLRKMGREFELIVVDDGSSDQTPRELEILKARYGPAFRAIQHAVNRGYGAALRSGFAAATKDVVFYTDGDGQYDPGELPLLLDHLTSSVDLVNGYKIKRHDPLYRIVIGSTYNLFVRMVFHLNVRDVDCDFRLVRRCLLQRAQLECDSGVICVEMIHRLQRLGCRVVEVPVHHYPRTAGRSQFFRFRALVETFLQLLEFYRRKEAPLSSAAELVKQNTK